MAEKKVHLQLKKAHERGFRLGRHVVKAGAPKEYSLNEKEQKELEGKGPQAWLKVMSKKDVAAMPKSNAENKKRQAAKKEE